MKTTLNEKLIAYLTLLSGLSISAVAIYYSVIGLTAIFAAAVIPIIVMGIVLEVSKLVATLWLKQNWSIAPRTIKIYLIIAIAILMLITSLGIFGFLSKAHSDQSLISGDVQSKLAIYDEKINTAKENIEADRRQLKQMDEAVDQVMARSTTEEGASRSNAIRKAQARDRSALAKNIEANQKLIAAINEEAAPIRAEIRKVEAEVGPIKYIAKFIYGETDKNLLEKAVIWVIIVIVLVFDPLAVILLLASQFSFQSFKEKEQSLIQSKLDTVEPNIDQAITDPLPVIIPEINEEKIKEEDEFDLKNYPYLFKTPQEKHPPGIDPVGPQVYKYTDDNERPQSTIIKKYPEKTVKVFSFNNQEQNEESVNQQIDQEDYLLMSQQKLNAEAEFYVGQIKSRQLDIDDVPEHIKDIVKTKILE
jgi:hypothetical protein